jgi:hypothetical protein
MDVEPNDLGGSDLDLEDADARLLQIPSFESENSTSKPLKDNHKYLKW